MPVADALAWYEAAGRGRVTIRRNGPPIALVTSLLGVEPSIGRFCVGGDVPFAAQSHSSPRIHRLVPMEGPDEAVQTLRSSAAAREWLATNAGFDPYFFEEWLGSISLLAPDPLLSGVDYFTLGRGADGAERIILQAHRRRYVGYPEVDANALKLVLLQRRPAGWIEVMPTAFDKDGFSSPIIQLQSAEFGYGISCPTRGLLRMVPPTSWMGEINVGFGLVNAVLDVEVPTGGRRKPAFRYHDQPCHRHRRLPCRRGALRSVPCQGSLSCRKRVAAAFR